MIMLYWHWCDYVEPVGVFSDAAAALKGAQSWSEAFSADRFGSVGYSARDFVAAKVTLDAPVQRDDLGYVVSCTLAELLELA